MSVDRPDETELELVERRGREADQRYRDHLAAIEAHRQAGTLIVTPAVRTRLDYFEDSHGWPYFPRG